MKFTLLGSLSEIARDYLAVPATSVSVEQLFSASRLICTDVTRSSLKADCHDDDVL